MIKHIITTNDNGDIVYQCNQAVGITQEKVAQNPDNATCKNCIRANNKLKCSIDENSAQEKK